MSTQSVATYGGTARLLVAEPPAWLVDLVPGARKAHTDWQKANADGKAAQSAEHAARQEVYALTASGALSTEVEVAERVVAERVVEVRAAGRRARDRAQA